MDLALPRPPEEMLLGFTLALRAAGVDITADRERAYLRAAAALGLDDPHGCYHAGRATLCGSPADLERHDTVYAAWFGGKTAVAGQRFRPPAPTAPAALAEVGEGGTESDQQESQVAQASSHEVLRQRDVATLSAGEKAELGRLFTRIQPRAPRRWSHRRTPARRGEVDPARTLREMLRRLGEPGRVRHRRRAPRPRRVVMLIDVSGSMSPYADALLRLAHRFVSTGLPVEVFTFGTRLTHITRPLRRRDPDQALVAAGDAIPDWSGGTRLAEGIKIFLERWGRRGTARGAVVVVFSDGWERSDPEALGEQMRRLRVLAHRVIWVNPHRGLAGYAPVQAGIRAVLPYCDDFLAGHSLATFEEMTEVIAGA
ncbi:VWA domain containing CoxE-like family protein [Nostocoides australiense Ben110]|uniref:VWA domain containing CoxE-like family protein n=2 Tax=Nostocoides australiense TaxID=99480 RepID=W6K1E9_9MICO|nr:VWA domain containing CoxE-like family protein [Tetrasphaera australiensis Ben110]